MFHASIAAIDPKKFTGARHNRRRRGRARARHNRRRARFTKQSVSMRLSYVLRNFWGRSYDIYNPHGGTEISEYLVKNSPKPNILKYTSQKIHYNSFFQMCYSICRELITSSQNLTRQYNKTLITSSQNLHTNMATNSRIYYEKVRKRSWGEDQAQEKQQGEKIGFRRLQVKKVQYLRISSICWLCAWINTEARVLTCLCSVTVTKIEH